MTTVRYDVTVHKGVSLKEFLSLNDPFVVKDWREVTFDSLAKNVEFLYIF